MMDILDRLRLKIQRIPAGSCHTCNDACTNTDCLFVTSRQEIEDLRAERDEAVALLREIVAWRVAIECVAPELGGVATTLSRIDAFLAADSATHRENANVR